MKKIGIITFHNSYNCGSMLESYAMQEIIKKYANVPVEIIDFSNAGQKRLYNAWFKNNSIKNIIKNVLLIPAHKKIVNNNSKYEMFKKKNFNLSKEYTRLEDLEDKEYIMVISGSDQIWNITIDDSDDAYFLPWVKNAKKVAYAPSFGAKRIQDYTAESEKYKNYLNSYDALSIRENNGRKWIKELIGKDVPVLIDPTLLLSSEEYDKLVSTDLTVNGKYIFFYCPDFNLNICKYVKNISKKYHLKVITWSTKSYYINFIKRFGFELAEYENPSAYLYYIKNAELVITTSFHGTIFSTIYRKNFITVKNGGMYGKDDRVITLLSQLDMLDRLIPYKFDEDFNYLANINYDNYERNLKRLKEEAKDFLMKNIGELKDERCE